MKQCFMHTFFPTPLLYTAMWQSMWHFVNRILKNHHLSLHLHPLSPPPQPSTLLPPSLPISLSIYLLPTSFYLIRPPSLIFDSLCLSRKLSPTLSHRCLPQSLPTIPYILPLHHRPTPPPSSSTIAHRQPLSSMFLWIWEEKGADSLTLDDDIQICVSNYHYFHGGERVAKARKKRARTVDKVERENWKERVIYCGDGGGEEGWMVWSGDTVVAVVRWRVWERERGWMKRESFMVEVICFIILMNLFMCLMIFRRKTPKLNFWFIKY